MYYRLGEPPPPLGRLGAELPPLGRLGAELPPLGRLIDELPPLGRLDEDEVLPVGRTVVVEEGRLAVVVGAGRELEVVDVERVVVVVTGRVVADGEPVEAVRVSPEAG